MSQQIFRANLAAVGFPFTVDSAGRTVIIRGQDQTHAPTIQSSKDLDKDTGIPQLLYGHNILPTGEGYKSVDFNSTLLTIPCPEDTIVQVVEVINSDSAVAYIGMGESGRVYSIKAGETGWTLISGEGCEDFINPDIYFDDVVLLLKFSSNLSNSGSGGDVYDAVLTGTYTYEDSSLGGKNLHVSSGSACDCSLGTTLDLTSVWTVEFFFTNEYQGAFYVTHYNGFIEGIVFVTIAPGSMELVIGNFRSPADTTAIQSSQYDSGTRHVALCSNGTTTKLYVDGVYINSTSSVEWARGIEKFFRIDSADGENSFDEFRVTDGVCRYTDEFTPPTIEFIV